MRKRPRDSEVFNNLPNTCFGLRETTSLQNCNLGGVSSYSIDFDNRKLSSAYVINQDLETRCTLTKNFDQWVFELADDPDKNYLLSGIAKGFYLVPDISFVTRFEAKNYSSALNFETKALLDMLFHEEFLAGKISRVTSPPLRVNAIGEVSKKGSSVPWPITDCSQPPNDFDNSYMLSETFSFESVDDAIRLSTLDCHRAIVDLKSAYRSVRVYPPQRQIQGCSWRFATE